MGLELQEDVSRALPWCGPHATHAATWASQSGGLGPGPRTFPEADEGTLGQSCPRLSVSVCPKAAHGKPNREVALRHGQPSQTELEHTSTRA